MSRVINFAEFRRAHSDLLPDRSAVKSACVPGRAGGEPAAEGSLHRGGTTARSPSGAEHDTGPTCQEGLQLVAAFRKIGTGSRRRAVMAFVKAVSEMS